MDKTLLLCVDLDRTLLPNGPDTESPEARRRFTALASRPEVRLVYVTGRDIGRVDRAVVDYGVPHPEVAITDVGTEINYWVQGEWRPDRGWEERLRSGWYAPSADELARALEPKATLVPQDASRQGRYKRSFYAPVELGPWYLGCRDTLASLGIRCRLVHSVDPIVERGLLDLIPEGAGKAAAIAYLMEALELPEERAVFAGDSANDLDVLTGSVRTVLVANATDDVKHAAMTGAQAADHADRLYVARGGFLGMNGNYSAGVLEGVAHFLPETIPWITEAPGVAAPARTQPGSGGGT